MRCPNLLEEQWWGQLPSLCDPEKSTYTWLYSLRNEYSLYDLGKEIPLFRSSVSQNRIAAKSHLQEPYASFLENISLPGCLAKFPKTKGLGHSMPAQSQKSLLNRAALTPSALWCRKTHTVPRNPVVLEERTVQASYTTGPSPQAMVTPTKTMG